MTRIDRILVATDFSPDASFALDLAREGGRCFTADILLLHVDEGTDCTARSGEDATRRDRIRATLDDLRDSLAADGLATRVLLRPGDPAREILHVAQTEGARMIVLGTHGTGHGGGLLLGSVADRVVRHAMVPVLLVRHPSRPVTDTTGFHRHRGHAA